MKRLSVLVAAAVITVSAIGAGYMATEKQEVSAAGKTYGEYVDIASLGSGLNIEPTLVFEPATVNEITEASTKSVRPASVILTVDTEMNVKFGTESIGFTLLFDAYLRSRFIPVVRIDESTVGPFIDYLKTEYAISDMMAISSDISVIDKLYKDNTAYLVNTVYDLTDTKLSADRYAEWNHVAEANVSGCNILMYDGSDENLPVAAEYVEAMAKVCWAYTESEEEAVSAIAAGCYGVASKSDSELTNAISYFKKNGFARAQYIAAHRGITGYANEQSLTGIMASANEGATHVEIDIQITKDRQILINHDSDIMNVTGKSGQYFANATAEQMKKNQFNKYSTRYGDTFASLREVCEWMQYTDVILIVELKLDNASAKAVDELQAIETFRDVMKDYPEMNGHWICITFYAPYADKMKELLPEIPVGYLGAGGSGKEASLGQTAWNGEHKAMNEIAGKIEFLRRRHLIHDEMMSAATNATAQRYLARGYVQNTWTFDDLSHFTYKANIATTNRAEECALLVKEIPNTPLTLSEQTLAAGKVKVPCVAYNGWIAEKECEIIPVSREGNTGTALLYYREKREASGSNHGCEYGIYSRLTTYTVV